MKRIHFILISLAVVGLTILVTLIVLKNKNGNGNGSTTDVDGEDSDINDEQLDNARRGVVNYLGAWSTGGTDYCSCAWTYDKGYPFCPPPCTLSSGFASSV